MTVLWWFIYRRWRMISWTKTYGSLEKKTLINNAYKVNLCSCRDHKAIYRDMQKILK
uniref:hypothetical protein n=1 Tax=Escherichia coli TaxID=562 RepID=UPI003D372340